ncbi:MAG: ATP-binding cassette domain-containing protein [Planctomycetes bacterium]|nr:ATP-binding cassette domain-containing protein [Planctomycetota bacterium]MCB9909261.1 ATP-binding cassette domain-containing protein [Planctomycetota bacterium]HPF15326.1 ATP-binding cassette domain-containing protein [Planctomycetota bacterium]
MSFAVQTEGLVLEAGGVALTDPIDVQVEVGEHVLLLGPSGCGKTTFLRTLAGLASPAKGRLHLFGVLTDDGRTRKVAPHERSVGYLFQDGALWPQWTVAKTLDFVLARRGMARNQRRAEVGRLLEVVELTGKEKRSVPTLSGGEAQRVNLARALACDPKLLLLDEPLGPLDKELRHDLLRKIDELAKARHLTIVHVTHDGEEARPFAQREWTLRHGRLREVSSSGAVSKEEATCD